VNEHETDRSIERLIKLAGGRDMPSTLGTERARRAAQESWNRMLGQRADGNISARFRKFAGLAIAAGVAGLALFAWTHRAATVPPELVARVATLEGAATLREPGVESLLEVATPIHAGSTLATSKGRVALTFGDSLSLRVDQHTRLRFDGNEQVTLLEGALYVDSGGVNAMPALRIHTPAGEVRHVGTQFQVMVDGNTTRVRVREGKVLLTRESAAPTDIVTGDELSVTGGELHWQRGLPSYGAPWAWSAAIAPPLEIENRPLAEFLAWTVREQGWQLRYGDQALQQRVLDIRLHGSLDRLGTEAMLERVSLVTGVSLRARDGVLWVGEVRR